MQLVLQGLWIVLPFAKVARVQASYDQNGEERPHLVQVFLGSPHWSFGASVVTCNRRSLGTSLAVLTCGHTVIGTRRVSHRSHVCILQFPRAPSNGTMLTSVELCIQPRDRVTLNRERLPCES